METQLSENMQVAVLDPEAFGGLIKLPTILKQNQDLAARAVGKVSVTLEPIRQIDLATVDAHTMETHDITLADIQARLKDAYDIMEGRRKPATSFMDQVKSMFTAEEKKITAIGAEVKTLRDGWQREKARRTQAEQAKRDNEIAAAQQKIRERAEKEARYTVLIGQEVTRLINLMHTKYASQTSDTIDAYEANLKAYNPTLAGAEYDKLLGEATPLTAELFSNLSTNYTDRLTEERNRVLDQLPSRKAELIRIAGDAKAQQEANDRIAQEAKEREETMKHEQAVQEQSIANNAAAAEMDATFDIASQATPSLGISKGTVVKQKYEPANHSQYIQILHWYIKNQLATLTLEDLNKKLGFMKTAADKALAAGERIEGVKVVEDFSTRSASRKTA